MSLLSNGIDHVSPDIGRIALIGDERFIRTDISDNLYTRLLHRQAWLMQSLDHRYHLRHMATPIGFVVWRNLTSPSLGFQRA